MARTSPWSQLLKAADSMVELQHVCRIFNVGGQEVRAMDDVSLTIDRGAYVSIMGPSGSGKSTLLNIIGLLDTPDSGSYLLQGRDVTGLSDRELAAVRGRAIGFIFQFYNILPTLTVKENVDLIRDVVKNAKDSTEILNKVGLNGQENKFPNQLSGGEQQRVSIARAIVNTPKVLIADEPTGNLDPENSWEIMKLLDRINAQGTTIVMATHNSTIVNTIRHRVIAIENGRIIRDQVEGEYGYDD